MSPVALAECLERFIAQAVHFSCCVVGAVRSFFYKCKWRHGLIVEEEKSSFNVIKYFGLFSPTSLNDAILLYIMMWEPNPHIPSDLGRECRAHAPSDTGSRYRRCDLLKNPVPKSK